MLCFFCGEFIKSCCHNKIDPTCQPAKPGKSYKKDQNFNKTAICSHHCPLRHPAPSLWHWYAEVYLRIFESCPSNPTTFLGLCSPSDFRQSMESPMGVTTFKSTEKAHTSTTYDCILRIWQKRCVISSINIKTRCLTPIF